MQNSNKSSKSILIIGAGFTGLTAAYEFVKLGCHVTVVEREAQVGGLAGGFTIEGHPIEKAYHHLFRTDRDILSLIAELGLEQELGWFESKIAMVEREGSSNGSKQEFSLLPFNGAVDLLKYKPLSLFNRLRAGIVVFFLQKYKNWQTLKSQTAMEWMKKWSGRAVTEKIWGMLLTGKFSRFAENISMAWLWARIHIRANSRKNPFEKEMLAYPTKGFASISEKIVSEIMCIDSLSEVKLNTSVESIKFENRKPHVKIYGVTKGYDAILSTVPSKVLLSILDEESRKQFPQTTSIDYLSAVVLAFSSSQSLSKYYWHNISDTNAPFLVFLQHTNLVPSTWYKGNEVYYIGAYVPTDSPYMTMPQNEIETKWFSYLKELFPKFEQKELSESHLFKFSHAQHVVTTDYESKIPPYKLMSGLYQSNFAQIYPEDRGVNYAVREGKRIAATILSDLLQ